MALWKPVCFILESIVAKTDLLLARVSALSAAQAEELDAFSGFRPPKISLRNYLRRIWQNFHCSPSCFVLALVYIDRLTQNNEKLLVSSYNIHRIVLTSVVVAAKFHDDEYYSNTHYAYIGGISCYELTRLEMLFTEMVNF